jgi:hypothetical protein
MTWWTMFFQALWLLGHALCGYSGMHCALWRNEDLLMINA